MKGFTLVEVMVAVVLILVVVVGVGVSIRGCGGVMNDQSGAARAVENYGFKNVTITSSFDLFCCGRDDLFKYGFSAQNAQGQPVSGCVCGGITKGYTVRLK